MHSTRHAGAALIALAALGFSAPAHAQFTQLQTAGQLGSGDTTLSFSGAGSVSSPFIQTSTDNALTFTAASGPALYLQNADGTNFDFAAGTTLLETTAGGGADGPLIIDFTKGVTEFGLSAQNFAPDTEAFSLIAYDGNRALGGFSTDLTDNSQDLGTALFLGGSAAGSDVITRLSITSVSSEQGAANDFLIGPVTYAPVPEASTTVSLGLGLLLLGGCFFKARKKAA